jgi:hypothetical protein
MTTPSISQGKIPRSLESFGQPPFQLLCENRRLRMRTAVSNTLSMDEGISLTSFSMISTNQTS